MTTAAPSLAEEETKAAVDKVRALMNQLGVTLEHLSSAMARKGAKSKKAIASGKPASTRRAGKGVVKYRDPQTGATWTGFGRAPGWIVGVENRDAFLVSSGTGQALLTGANAAAAKKKAAKKATAKKAAPAKKTAAKKSTKNQSAATKASGKKAGKTPVKRVAAKKVAKKKAASAAALAAPAAVDSPGNSVA